MVDRCIVCGAVVPEGRMVCFACSGEIKIKESEREYVQEILDLSRMQKRYGDECRQ